MKVRVSLHGHLRKFGSAFDIDIETPQEALRFLFSQVNGFEAHMRNHLKSNFRLVLDGKDAPAERISQPLFGVSSIKLVPIVRGSKSNGVQMITGAILVVAGMVASAYGGGGAANQLISMGIAMMVGGVAQMLAKSPSSSSAAAAATSVDRSAGKFFSGPVNTYGQGGCVPVVYGLIRTGGHCISANSNTETYSKGANGGAFQGGDGIGGSTGDGNTTPLVFSLDPK